MMIANRSANSTLPPVGWFVFGMFQFMAEVCAGQFEMPFSPLVPGGEKESFLGDINPG
jgi:hypothetical protein